MADHSHDASLEIAARFGANLRRARKRAGLSHDVVSIRASMHRTEISLLERGKRVPRVDTLIKLMGVLDASAEDLLDGIDWRSGEFQEGGFSHDPPRAREPT